MLRLVGRRAEAEVLRELRVELRVVAAARRLHVNGRQWPVLVVEQRVSYETFNRWKAKYGGMNVSEAQEKRRLEDENAKLLELVAQFALDIDTLKVALGKKW